MSNRRTQRSLTFYPDTLRETEKCMEALNINPDGWGEEAKYVEDAVRIKNMLVLAGKWIPAEEIDIKRTQIKAIGGK